VINKPVARARGVTIDVRVVIAARLRGLGRIRHDTFGCDSAAHNLITIFDRPDLNLAFAFFNEGCAHCLGLAMSQALSYLFEVETR
jgi:hypothetical protein